MPKFSCIIANPPYLRGMHTDFLALSREKVEDGGHILFLHPSTFYIIQKPVKHAPRRWFIKHQRELVSLKLFNANVLFGIQSFVPMAIAHFQAGYDNGQVFKVTDDYGYHEYTDVHRISAFGDRPEYHSFVEKVFTKMPRSFEDVRNGMSRHNTRRVEKEWYVDVARIRAHPGQNGEYHGDDFFTFFPRGTKPIHRSADYEYRIFGFDTEQEAQNCLDYLMTNFARRCLSIWKYNQHLDAGELKTVPYMDFTDQWDDERLADYFGLTTEERAFCDELPDYYRKILTGPPKPDMMEAQYDEEVIE